MLMTFRDSATRLTNAEIKQWLWDLRAHAYPPESGFAVTAILSSTVAGHHYYFAGVNSENIDHTVGTHAEAGALAAMTTMLGKYATFDEAWIMGAPKALNPTSTNPQASINVTCCGPCRQKLFGCAAPDAPIHSFSLTGEHLKTDSVATLLPDAFNFAMIDPVIADEIKANQPANLPSVPELEARLVRKGPLTELQIEEWLRSLEPVDFASKTSHAMVLRLDNGYYVAGVKLEEASYSGLNVAQSAVANAVGAFGQTPKIDRVWVMGKAREEKEYPLDAQFPLPNSALQVLAEHAESPRINLCLMNEAGDKLMKSLPQWAMHIPTTASPILTSQRPFHTAA